MTEIAEPGRRGGRPMVLAAVLLIEIAAALFFVADTVSEMVANGPSERPWFEMLVTLALMIGVGMGIVELRRAMIHQGRQDNALATASGEMNRVIQDQFEKWRLTPAERDVGYLALKGLDIAEIAGLRKAAPGTVRAQLSGIYAKAGTSNRAQFAAFFVEDLLAEGLLTRAVPLPDWPGGLGGGGGTR